MAPDEEEQALAMEAEMSLFDEAVLPNTPAPSLRDILSGMGSRGARLEKIDARALANELERLRKLPKRNDRDDRWLAWLETADKMAEPRPKEGEPLPDERTLVVTYAKRRSIGRRTASHPGMQHCPSGLRPLLVMFYYHDVDIVSCHPTLMLQVALHMGVPAEKLDTLHRYVHGERDDMHKDIASFYGVHPKACKFPVLRGPSRRHVPPFCSTNAKRSPG